MRVPRRLDAEAHQLEEPRVDDRVLLVHAGGDAEVALGPVVGVAVVVDAHVVAAVPEGPVVVNSQFSVLRCHASATPSHSAARAVSPRWRARSEAATSPAIIAGSVEFE